MKRGRKSLVISTLVVIFLLATILFVLQGTFFHRYLASIVERGTGWKIQFSHSSLDLFRGAVTIHDLDVRDKTGKFQMTGKRVLVNLSSLSAIRGKLIVSNLEVDDPSIFLQKSGTSEKKKFSPEKVEAILRQFEKSYFSQNMILDRVVIRNFSLIPSEGTKTVVRQAALRIFPSLLREIMLEVHVEGAEGAIPLRNLDLTVSLEPQRIKLRQFRMILPKMSLEAKAEWTGLIEKGFFSLRGSLEIPTVLSQPLTFQLDSDFSKRLATIKKIEAFLGDASFLGKGSFHMENLEYELGFFAKNLPLEAIFQKLNSPVLKFARGTAAVDGRAKGRLPALKVESRATIENLEHGPIRARRVSGALDLDWPKLEWDASVHAGTDGRTQAKVIGGVTFKHIEGYEKLQAILSGLEAKFDNASLEDLVPSLKATGRLDGELHLEPAKVTFIQGNAKAKITQARWFLGPIDSLTTEVTFRPGGEIVFHHTEFKLPTLLPVQWTGEISINPEEEKIFFSGRPTTGFSFKGNYQKDTGPFQIESIQIQTDGHNLRGDFTFYTGGRLNGHLTGPFNLEWLDYFPAIFRDGRGTANLSLSLSGSSHDPLLKGFIEFDGNELGIRGFSEELTNLHGRLAIDGNSLSPLLSGHLGDGEFKLGGRVLLAHWKPEALDLSLKGTNLTLAKTNNYRIDFDTDVSLKGRFPSPLLEGRVDIVDGRYVKKFVLRDFVLKPFEEPTETAPWEESLRSLQLSLKIKNSGDLRIKNNIASLFLQSDLQISGSFGRPRIEGALTASEGEFYLLGSKFSLTEGRLEFLDPSRREPYLTLSAQASERSIVPSDYSVFVEIKGYLSNLEVSLSSNPGLPREDILSLITVGKTQEELKSTGQVRRSLSAEILAGEITSILESPLSKTTGLDVFRLEASETGAITRFSIGKNITDRLLVEFMNDLDPQTAERMVQANYYLTDNILLKGFRVWTTSTIPRYRFNISFRFRLD